MMLGASLNTNDYMVRLNQELDRIDRSDMERCESVRILSATAQQVFLIWAGQLRPTIGKQTVLNTFGIVFQTRASRR